MVFEVSCGSVAGSAQEAKTFTEVLNKVKEEKVAA